MERICFQSILWSSKSKSLKVCIIVGLLTLSVLGQTRQETKNLLPDDILERPVPGNDLEYYATTDAFYASLGRARVAGGMVKIVSCEEDKFKQALRPMGSPLRQILDAIVVADTRHRWEVQDGVINLLPADGEPALLGIRITEFQAKNVTSARDALSQLMALPEVKKGRDDLNLKPGVALINSLSSPNPPAFSVRCKNATLRDALNAIARAQGQAIWEYIEIHCDGKHEVVIRF